LNVVTFYADADLPPEPKAKQAGFDWRWAIGELSRTAGKANLPTRVVTDTNTDLPGAWLRAGDAKQAGLMLWLLDAQEAAIWNADAPMVMVSPDTLIAGRLNMLFGAWDICLLTRKKPKPIVNSVIAVNPSERVGKLWNRVCAYARRLPEESRSWGADIDALVDMLAIKPMENGIREFDGVRVRFMPMNTVFQSVPSATPHRRLPVPLWDFKGSRKRLMPTYARLL
jgi:hypothetical protein